MPTALRALCQDRGWTQTELAVRVGVSQKSIVNWELGRLQPRPHHRSALIAALGIADDDLRIALPSAAGGGQSPTGQTDQTAFGVYALRCRRLAKVSLVRLAKGIQLAPVEIQAVEQGQAPPPRGIRLRRWAEILGVDADVFVAWALPGTQTPDFAR